MLTSDQIRLARALLRWSARELAQKSGVHITTVQRIERGMMGVRNPLVFRTHPLNRIID